MLKTIVKNLFGSRNDRLLKDYGKKAQQINSLEDATKKLSDTALKAKTTEFKKRLNEGQKLDDLLVEAFAVVREASCRVLEMRHFDVQLIGGMALHDGKISEMRTGEGKTLVATLPLYLNALVGKGVHVITVNDYLAKRDAEWMGQIYRFLGLEVGINLSSISSEEKKKAYEADITYGTNNEFGFDYLRDNMIFSKEERVQRKLHYGLVDEVDSILIDEARTPLIISGQAEDNVELYTKINLVVAKLSKQKTEEEGGDYWIDEKAHQVILSESGHENVEKLLIKAELLSKQSSLYDATNISLVHHINASLKARNLFNKDQHYVVKDNSIIIVDEFSGRMMPGRRWSEGIHQAVEAKEGVEIQKENQTLASITFQNYFRMYEKLSGMTGTADTEAFEFNQIYGLETIIIPPHRTTQRKDMMDKVYRSSQERYAAVIEDIKACQKIDQPVLVGTTSIENSELISALLTKVKLKHQVLNAKHHEKEAHIIAQAGRPGMITIATNMAGRGTDIVLGGSIEADIHEIKLNDKLTESKKEKEIQVIKDAWKEQNSLVVKVGGLHIIGTERHESRRVDNQLRGRAGRQGDPGSSRFYLSLEDSLLRIFASDRVSAIMEKLKMPEGEAIEHSWVTKAIENAQRDVNISFVNELALIFDLMNIDTADVLEAAQTKWNFLPFKPGLVGGHCIGVDPYYLAYQAEKLGHKPQVILSGRKVNDNMAIFVVNKLLKLMVLKNQPIQGAYVLILGLTFKENCTDIRNSKVFDVYHELKTLGMHVDVFDPNANSEQVFKVHNINPISELKTYDAILLTVAHNQFLDLDFNALKSNENSIIFDLKSILPRELVDARL